MASPFDLHGPQFLVFYVALGACALLVLALLRHAGESSQPCPVNLSDPYLIAYLRGGKAETLRVATMCLVHRGFLTPQGSNLAAAPGYPRAALRIPLEQRLYDHFSVQSAATSVFKSGRFDRDLQPYKEQLERLDLIPNTIARMAQNFRAAVAIVVLWLAAGIKIVIALSLGRSNVRFLVILSVVFAIAAIGVARTRQTRRGAAMVSSLRTLFGSLKQRTPTLLPAANPDELLIVGAVFGAATAFPLAKTLYPKASSSGSCGSSCGSSCGGGGCGSGCGGCGS